MGLVLKNKISLDTQLGRSEIQLLFGDITQLPHEDRVDFIFVSAFPGDYAPVPGTLIGALHRNLNLKVAHVAKDKALDLRQSFNCWVSKPLPDSVPYRRLVCFERMNRFEKLSEQISGMFRAMMPVFNNQDTSVITPLLASGNQGNSEINVLRAIVPAACQWIKAGLPLQCLKIVVYTRDPHAASEVSHELVEIFSELKAKWEAKHSKEVTKVEKTIDVCLSFSDGDEQYVGQICSSLCKMYSDIAIHSELFNYDHQACWQEKIFDVMVKSRKIVAVLTPNYVGKPECLEQFNLALCCNRLTGAEVLAPFYLQTVDTFPAYMTLIQYTECRVRKEGEKEEEKILSACSMLVKEMDKDYDTDPSEASESSVAGQQNGTAASTSGQDSAAAYDVFISYAHKTPAEARKFYENVLDIDPSLRVFLDRSELRTGNSWQEALYEAADKARVVVAFVSDPYIQSTVCQDEYNIALARYMSAEGVYFLPLLTSQTITELPAMFSAVPLVDIRELVYEEDHFSLAEVVVRWLHALKAASPILNRFRLIAPGRKTRIPYVTTKWRENEMGRRFTIDPNTFHLKLRKPPPGPTEDERSSTSVVVSFAQDCFKHATLLSRLLEQEGEGRVTCQFLTSPQSQGVQAPKLQLLDSADMVVVIVSDDYLESVQHQHELHISLCRQRMSQDQRVVYLIESHHTLRQPVYAYLLHYSISMGDELWAHLARRTYQDTTPVAVPTPDSSVQQMHCSGGEYLALSAAAVDIVDKLNTGKQEGGSGMPTNIVNLAELKEGKQDPVPVSEVLIPFSSLVEERPSHEDQVDTAQKPGLSRHKSNKLQDGEVNRRIRQSIHPSRSCQVL